MKKLVWCYVVDNKKLPTTDLFTVNGKPITHPEIYTIIATHPTNPELSDKCGSKLFHSNTNIIYPLELEKMVECYNAIPTVQHDIINHGVPITNNNKRINQWLTQHKSF